MVADPDRKRMTDAEAMQRLSEGDVEALRVLYERHRDRLQRLGCRYLGDPAAAEDVVQQVFVKAYEAAPRFRGDAKASTWLYRITVNACLDKIRRRRTLGIEDAQPGGLEQVAGDPVSGGGVTADPGPRPGMAHPDPEADPMGAAERRVLQDRLNEALAELSPSQRMAFVMRHWEGMSIREIAGALGAAEGTVKSHLFRAVRALRAELADLTP